MKQVKNQLLLCIKRIFNIQDININNNKNYNFQFYIIGISKGDFRKLILSKRITSLKFINGIFINFNISIY